MKNNYERLLIMGAKTFIYGILMQCFMYSVLIAEEGKAQPEKLNKIQVKLDRHEYDLKPLITEIETKTSFTFFYAKSLLNQNSKISFNKRKQPLSDILMQVSGSTNLKFMRINDAIYLGEKDGDIPTSASNGQPLEVVVSGTVTSLEDNESIPGVNVVEKGTVNGTVTDVDGKYSLEVEEGATLIFSSVGFITEEITIQNQSVIDIALAPDIQQLQDIVVIGYGTQKKADVTGSIASVDADKIQGKPNLNILQALQGNAAGVNITNTNPAPGASQEITIRGINSINASNSPLVVLDGIPYGGSLNDINPNDIASVDILKDASAAAIYGSRGANGVILITSKKGTSGKPRIQYSGYAGIQTILDQPDLMNGDEYIQRRIDYANFDGVAFNDPAELLNSSEVENYENGTEYDWWDEVTQPALQQEHLVSFSGGTDNLNYYTSLSYFDQEGVVEGVQYNRLSLKLNLDNSITDWLRTGANVLLSRNDYSGAEARIYSAMRLSPYAQKYDDNGEYSIYPMSPDIFWSNPLSYTNTINDDIRNRNFITLFADVDLPFIKGLSYRMNVGLDKSDQKEGTYQGRNTFEGFENNGIARIYNRDDNDWTWENILRYQLVAKNHSLDITGLFSRQHFENEFSSINGRGYVNDNLAYHSIHTGETIVTESGASESDIVSYMLRFNYNFASKYYATLTARRDGYSGFGANTKYGFFPSVGLGWTFSEEEFLANASWLNFGKLRVSYGENGNQAIEPYRTLASLVEKPYIFGDQGETAPGFIPAQMENVDLGWETTRSLNVGLDFAVLNSRLDGTINFYKSNTSDLLLTRSIPVMTGYISVLDNIGETQNTGIEVTLNGTPVETPDFRWGVSLNMSANNDEIVSLYGDDADDVGNKWFIGESIQVYHDYVFDGVWQEGDNIAESHMPNERPGFAKFVDTDDNGVLNAEDREIIGSLLPDWRGGITNTLTYKNWEFSFLIYTVQGGVKNNSQLDTRTWTVGRTNFLNVDYWTPENPINDFPSLNYTNPLNHGWYQDPSFIRLRDVTLSYFVPETLLDRIGVESLKLYLNGRNLFTITDYTGLDPETDDQFGYPNTKTYTFGVNLVF